MFIGDLLGEATGAFLGAGRPRAVPRKSAGARPPAPSSLTSRSSRRLGGARARGGRRVISGRSGGSARRRRPPPERPPARRPTALPLFRRVRRDQALVGRLGGDELQ